MAVCTAAISLAGPWPHSAPADEESSGLGTGLEDIAECRKNVKVLPGVVGVARSPTPFGMDRARVERAVRLLLASREVVQ